MLIPSVLDIAGWLGYCFIGYTAYLVAYVLWKRERPRHAERWMRWLRNLRKPKGMTSLERLWPIAVVLVVCSTLVYAMVQYRGNVEIHTNVRIISHPTSLQWWMEDDQNPGGYMYYACDDLPHHVENGQDWNGNESWIKAGYFAQSARWEVMSDCNSIKRQGLEFKYIWKPDGQAVTLEEHDYHAVND